MAFHLPADPMVGQAYIASGAFRNVGAIVTNDVIGIAPAILKQDDLYSFDVGTEACLSIAGIIAYAKHGFNGVVNVYPFTCMPSTATSAVTKPIMSESRVPYLDAPYDSSIQPGREATIRTFMYQANQHMKRHGRKTHH